MLLGPLALTLSIGAIALGFYLERSMRQDLLATVDSELVRAMNITRPGGGPGGPALGREGAVPQRETTESGSEAPIELRVTSDEITILQARGDMTIDESELLGLAGTAGTFTIDGVPRYRVATAAAPDGETMVIALSLERVDQSLASLHQNLIIGGLVLLGAQVLAVWFIAGAVAKPVKRMSALAHNIAGGDLEAPVGPPHGPRETADLATDLGLMLKQLRSTIAEQQLSAAQANQARADMERFMADASHELRTPLTALKGYSDLYRGGMLDPEGLDRAMERIGSESERLTDLVVGLLQLTREKHETPVPVDVAATATQVVEDLSAAHPDRSISIEADAASVMGDANRLHQAVLNLGANACHHTPTDTAISVTVSTDADQVHVAVIDHGHGVDVDQADALFVAFARGDESRSRASHDGAGLGLALVQRIAEQHGGSAWVRETTGGGATFGLSLPAAAESGADNL